MKVVSLNMPNVETIGNGAFFNAKVRIKKGNER
jgi:hypothetical protein